MILKFPRNLYAPPSPINMTTMIRQHTKFPYNVSSPKQTFNFEPLSKGSITNPISITAFDTYLNPTSPEAV